MARRISLDSRLGAAALLCVAALACAGKSVRDESEDGERAGEGGTRPSGGDGGDGGRGGTFGTSGGTPATGGASGTATGGTSGTAAGGSSGTSAGSSGSSSGGSSTGGSSGTCPDCAPVMCTTTPIPTTTINDFDNLYFLEGSETPVGIFGALDEQGMLKPEWWLGYFSGSYVYPAIPRSCSGEPTPAHLLVQDETSGVLHVTGTVGGPSGFGVWLGPCIVDMSSWGGVSFTVSGQTGTGALDLKIHTSSNTDPDACQIGRGKCTTNVCAPPGVRLSLFDETVTLAVPWTAFGGGAPGPTVDSSEILALSWDFVWESGMVPYPVDVTLDNVMLFE